MTEWEREGGGEREAGRQAVRHRWSHTIRHKGEEERISNRNVGSSRVALAWFSQLDYAPLHWLSRCDLGRLISREQ